MFSQEPSEPFADWPPRGLAEMDKPEVSSGRVRPWNKQHLAVQYTLED